MRPKYDGIRYFSANDMSIGGFFLEAKAILDTFSPNKKYCDINEIIELYNVNQLILSGGIKEEFCAPYKETAKSMIKTIAVFFNSISNATVFDLYNSVCIDYIADL